MEEPSTASKGDIQDCTIERPPIAAAFLYGRASNSTFAPTSGASNLTAGTAIDRVVIVVAATDWSLRVARTRLYRNGCRSDRGGYAMSGYP